LRVFIARPSNVLFRATIPDLPAFSKQIRSFAHAAYFRNFKPNINTLNEFRLPPCPARRKTCKPDDPFFMISFGEISLSWHDFLH